MEDDLNFRIWKMTSTFQEMENYLNLSPSLFMFIINNSLCIIWTNVQVVMRITSLVVMLVLEIMMVMFLGLDSVLPNCW